MHNFPLKLVTKISHHNSEVCRQRAACKNWNAQWSPQRATTLDVSRLLSYDNRRVR
ncbi:hypothetical protein J6590_054843 [Homalodisca vitripennis]|nr:hypothetical protein J6590_054843 [Homalodisca vitripennis]